VEDRIIRSLIKLLLLLASLWELSAFDWPLEDPRIRQQFAQPVGKDFSKGMRFQGAGMVQPIETGEVIFTREGTPFESLIPQTEKNMVIIEHANGYRSVYGNFEKSPFLGKRVFAGDVIGYVQSPKDGLYLSLIDIELEKTIHPLLLMPKNNDTIRPRLEEVLLESQEESLRLRPNASLSRGYKVFKASLWDLSPGLDVPLLPYRVSAFLNGTVLLDITFSGLVVEGDKVVLDQDRRPSVEDLFDPQGYLILGREYLSPGENELELVIRDYFANTTTQVFPFKVR